MTIKNFLSAANARKTEADCSATKPPIPSLIVTKTATSAFIKASNPSIIGGKASGSCLGVVARLEDGSTASVEEEVAADAGTPLEEVFGSVADEAMSSKREVAASRLQKAVLVTISCFREVLGEPLVPH